MRVSVVVPTRNSSAILGKCLESITTQSVDSQLVVVDNKSTDKTWDIAGSYGDVVIQGGPERSAQRNIGARASDAEVVGFIDSDMVLSPDVVRDAVRCIEDGAAGVIVPEITVGDGFWARVRAFERSFYTGSDAIEAARFFRRDVFEAVGGFDENLTGPEDWDLSQRVQKVGRIDRIDASITHLEGRVTFIGACRKKAYYAPGLRAYFKKHGMAGVKQAASRPWLRHPRKLFCPLGVGLVALKVGEATAMSGAIVRSELKARLRRA